MLRSSSNLTLFKSYNSIKTYHRFGIDHCTNDIVSLNENVFASLTQQLGSGHKYLAIHKSSTGKLLLQKRVGEDSDSLAIFSEHILIISNDKIIVFNDQLEQVSVKDIEKLSSINSLSNFHNPVLFGKGQFTCGDVDLKASSIPVADKIDCLGGRSIYFQCKPLYLNNSVIALSLESQINQMQICIRNLGKDTVDVLNEELSKNAMCLSYISGSTSEFAIGYTNGTIRILNLESMSIKDEIKIQPRFFETGYGLFGSFPIFNMACLHNGNIAVSDSLAPSSRYIVEFEKNEPEKGNDDYYTKKVG